MSYFRLSVFKLFLAIVMMSMVSYGCSREKRALRALKKAEMLAPEMFVDTTFTVPVSVVIPERRKVDRLPLEFGRPITTRKDGVTTTLLVTHDTIYVNTIVEADTLTAERQVTVPVIKPQIVEDELGFFGKIERIAWMVIAILFVVLVINIINQIKK